MEVQCALELIDVYLNVVNQKDYFVLCAVNASDEPIGYVCYGPTPLTVGTYDLYWIAVDPAWQGRGVGSLLMEYVEQAVSRPQNTLVGATASVHRARLLIIETSSLPRYESARRMYQRHQYREVARIQDFYAEGDDRVIYAKRL
ncbi:MAG: GNAT family N-acetyltransferase [candidate division KSB1 bacterium]|nr:GNAT family N-acetyltransferase [candidate division KSB1 bacterium]MDZ7305407.1 GNAT family N-acetyltransferase [candidate division KSB1 bacterium]